MYNEGELARKESEKRKQYSCLTCEYNKALILNYTLITYSPYTCMNVHMDNNRLTVNYHTFITNLLPLRSKTFGDTWLLIMSTFFLCLLGKHNIHFKFRYCCYAHASSSTHISHLDRELTNFNYNTTQEIVSGLQEQVCIHQLSWLIGTCSSSHLDGN